MKLLRLPKWPRHKKLIREPGLYHVDRAFYHRDPVVSPSLSASIAARLLEGPPVLAWADHPRFNPEHGQDDTEAAELGTVCHAIMTGEVTGIRVVPFPNWRGETAGRLQKEARKEGRIPILQHKFDQLRKAILCLTNELARMDLSHLVGKDKMLAEPTIIWREAGSFWCRARLDWISREVRDPMTVVDLKTTSRSVPQHPEDLGRFMYSNGWDLQAAVYRAAVRALTGVSRVDVFFIVLQLGDVPTVTVAKVGTMLREIGHRRWGEACSIWVRSKANDSWPRSTGKVIDADAPPYLEFRWLGESSRENWQRTQAPDEES